MEIRSVNDLLVTLNELINLLKKNSSPSIHNDIFNGVWFRGQKNSNWALVPSIFREPFHNEYWISQEFNTRCSGLVQKGIPTNDAEWLALMQHYSLPTRLLDWTNNALVALYFSVENDEKHTDIDGKFFVLDAKYLNSISCNLRDIALPNHSDVVLRTWSAFTLGNNPSAEQVINYINDKNNRYTLTVDEQNDISIFFKRYKYPVAMTPRITNDRMRLQQGVFTIHGGKPCLPHVEEFTPVDLYKDGSEKGYLKVFIVPKEYKTPIRKELANLGVSKAALFPELEYQTSFVKDFVLGTV